MGRISNVIGIDDAPFAPDHQGSVMIVGAVFSGERLAGVVSSHVQRDGSDATQAIADMVRHSRFSEQVQAVFLQGIAVAGFNVIDIHALHMALETPVLAVARRAPDMDAMRRALLSRVEDGERKWLLIEKAGPMLPIGNLHAQFAGIAYAEAAALIGRFVFNGHVPEPLRTAHLIAGGIATGESRGRT